MYAEADSEAPLNNYGSVDHANR
eukprot:SAG31_NODE_27322_length_428_cov_0.498480_1_plen_22_part_01